MKIKNLLFWGIVFFCSVLLLSNTAEPEWGFFGHRRINRMAVFTLPSDMMPLYKKEIEYLTDHAVDPDKRRYATKHEAVRHYIDIDHWGEYPFDEIPRDWTEVLMKYTDVFVVNTKGDTIQMLGNNIMEYGEEDLILKGKKFLKRSKLDQLILDKGAYQAFFTEHILPQYYEDDWTIDCVSLSSLFSDQGIKINCNSAFAKDQFSGFGILPYHLLKMQNKLTKAFQNQDPNQILRISAEFGHYIGDAHVPLHTTENYNGQMTDQVGIHAFWESRIPELFADKNYDYFVGKAEYISNPKEYFWDIILKSHSYLDSVLLIEKSLSRTFPEDKQYCYDNRLERTILTQCKEYAAEYSRRMDGMVETRMQASILSIGSVWYTAWIDAGQPNLKKLNERKMTEAEQKALEEEEALFRAGDIKGREH